MNYQRIYDQIIKRAKSENRQKSGDVYYEAHHIIPRCLGGSNNKDNLVFLTAREHFLCHWLLHEIYPNNGKLLLAFDMMCKVKDKNQDRYIPSSRIVEYAKISASKYKKTIIVSEEKKNKQSKISKNLWKNPEYRNKITPKLIEFIRSKDKRLSQSNYMKNHNPMKNKDVSIKFFGGNHPKSKKVNQYDLLGNYIKSFDCIQDAARELQVNGSHISSVCSKKRPTAYGYKWEYQ